MFNFILTVVFLLVPVIVAAVDKKRKKEKRSQSVHAEPIDFSEIEGGHVQGSEILEHEKTLLTQESTVAQPKARPEKSAQKAKPAVEAKPKLTEKATEEITTETVKKDRKKLILYSEILKPKFDE